MLVILLMFCIEAPTTGAVVRDAAADDGTNANPDPLDTPRAQCVGHWAAPSRGEHKRL